MTATPVALLRSLVGEAITGRPSPRVGRVRITVVGRAESSFVVDLLSVASRVVEDVEGDADAELWLAAADVPRVIKGFSMAGIRQSGEVALIETLAALLDPGKNQLSVRAGADREH